MSIFVFDLDGTICFKGQPLQQAILAAFMQLEADGHEIVFASARPIRDIYPVIPKSYRQNRMIGGNGAFIFDGERIHVQSFSHDLRQKIERLIEQHQLTYLMDSAWDYSFTGPIAHSIYRQLDTLNLAKNVRKENLKEVVKCVLFTSKIEVQEALRDLSCVVYEHQQEALFDLSPEHVSKESGLTHLGIMPNTYIAFGNDQNDCQMLAQACESVCVGDQAQVAAYATHQCMENEVAKWIRILSSKYKYK